MIKTAFTLSVLLTLPPPHKTEITIVGFESEPAIQLLKWEWEGDIEPNFVGNKDKDIEFYAFVNELKYKRRIFKRFINIKFVNVFDMPSLANKAPCIRIGRRSNWYTLPEVAHNRYQVGDWIKFIEWLVMYDRYMDYIHQSIKDSNNARMEDYRGRFAILQHLDNVEYCKKNPKWTPAYNDGYPDLRRKPTKAEQEKIDMMGGWFYSGNDEEWYDWETNSLIIFRKTVEVKYPTLYASPYRYHYAQLVKEPCPFYFEYEASGK